MPRGAAWLEAAPRTAGARARHAVRGPSRRRPRRRASCRSTPMVSMSGVHPRPRCSSAWPPASTAPTSLRRGKDRDRWPIAARHRWRCANAVVRLRTAHVDDHRALFERVALDLGARVPPPICPPTNASSRSAHRIPHLVELLFQYGRYLLIACSRPGTQPANLQGLWNEEVRAPWSSNYTININTQMNYWPAETTGLAELHEPLIALVEGACGERPRTAPTNYGAGGWVAHHNTDVWRHTAHGRRLGHRRPGVGALADGRPVARAAPVRALPVRRRPAPTCAIARIR